MTKLWGGRFEKQTHRAVEEFTQSVGVDGRLWEADLLASQAHARMLGTVGVIPTEESRQIIAGLEALRLEYASQFEIGRSPFDPLAEDVHSEIEKRLVNLIGPVAGKLHTAR